MHGCEFFFEDVGILMVDSLYLPAFLHGELDAVAVDDDVEPEEGGDCWSDFEDCCDFLEVDLAQDVVQSLV